MRMLVALCGMLCLMSLAACRGEKAGEFLEEGRKLMAEGNYSGAVVFFKNSLEKDPVNSEVRLELGKAYLGLGKIDQAKDEFHKLLKTIGDDPTLNLELAKIGALERKPEDTLRHIALFEKGAAPTAQSKELAANAYFLQGDADKSEALLKEAIALDRTHIAAFTGLARVYLAQNKAEEAKTLSEQLLKEHPKSTEALLLRADIAMNSGEHAVAEECYRMLREMDPTNATAYYMQGVALLRQERVKDAQAVRDAMRRSFKEAPLEFMLSGLIAFQQGNYADSVTYFQNSVDKIPTLDGRYRLALAQSRLGQAESALSSARMVLDRMPDYAPARLLVAQILLSQGRFDDAQKEAERLVQHHPENANAHALLGKVLHAKNDKEAALKAFGRALELNPLLGEASLIRSSILMSEKRFDEAKKELTDAIARNASDVAARVALFNYYLGRRDTKAAGETVDEGLKVLPENEALLTMKASLLLGEKKEDEAFALLDKARKSNPDYSPALNLLMRQYILSGKIDKALEVCDDFLSRHPEDTGYLVASASMLDALKRPEEAGKRLHKAYALGERRAFVSLVQRELAAKKPEAAEKLFLNAMKTKESPELRTLFAEFYLGQGQIDKAAAVFDAIATAAPKEAALGKFRVHYAAKQYDKALEQAREMKKLESTSPLGAMGVADTLEALGKSEEALAELDAAYRKLQNPALLVSMAQLCLRMKQYDKAEAHFGAALRLNPKDGNSLMGQAYVYMQKKNYTDAIDHYKRALDLAPTDVAVLNNLAMAYAEEGKELDTAVDLAVKAFLTRPESPQIVDTLGYCLLKSGRLDEAVNVLNAGIGANPQDGQLHYRLGSVLLKAGKKQEGLDALKKSLELGPFSDEAEARKLLEAN